MLGLENGKEITLTVSPDDALTIASSTKLKYSDYDVWIDSAVTEAGFDVKYGFDIERSVSDGFTVLLE